MPPPPAPGAIETPPAMPRRTACGRTAGDPVLASDGPPAKPRARAASPSADAPKAKRERRDNRPSGAEAKALRPCTDPPLALDAGGPKVPLSRAIDLAELLMTRGSTQPQAQPQPETKSGAGVQTAVPMMDVAKGDDTSEAAPADLRLFLPWCVCDAVACAELRHVSPPQKKCIDGTDGRRPNAHGWTVDDEGRGEHARLESNADVAT